MSNSQNSSYNNISELNIDNKDNLSSSNGSLNNLKNNMNNNIKKFCLNRLHSPPPKIMKINQ